MKKPHGGAILLVEDDRIIADLLGDHLESKRFVVEFATDGVMALSMCEQTAYDAIVVDGQMPRMDGFELARKLRASSHSANTPLLMLTANAALDQKLVAFQAGLDDYLTKPFAFAEVVERLRALIRRNRRTVVTAPIVVGDLTLDVAGCSAKGNNRYLDLTPTGFRILHLLMRESPRFVSRREIVREIWGNDPPDSDALRSHIYRLRSELGKAGSTRLQTYRTLGFAIAEQDSRLTPTPASRLGLQPDALPLATTPAPALA